jgi:DegV family protein with EDD domain
MKIAITSDSVIDLTKELLEKYDIKLLNFRILLGDVEYRDGEISNKDIFKFVQENKVLPKTSAENQESYENFFSEVLKEYDALIHINLSSFMSVSHTNARLAGEKFNGKVEVVDSLSLSTGAGLLAIYARELANDGVSAQEIANKVAERTDKLQVSFVIERLDYLYKGGRCNALALLGANVLRIRPRITVKNGKMGSDKKYRGTMDRVIAKYTAEVLDEFNTPDLDKVFITYTTATPEMINNARQALSDAGFKNIYEAHAGCTIASHCGANTLGVIYLNDGE